MMKSNLEKLKMATNNYRLKDEDQLTEKILTYIAQRIQANQKEIEDLIQIKKETVTYLQIEHAIQKEIEKEIKYKDYQKMIINQDNFIATTLLMPIGTVAIEAYDTIEVVKYFIKAIQTRNAIAISDAEYDEQSVKFLILEIIQEALKKFQIDENLIMILPYEECFYSYFDKVIYTYNKQGKTLRQNGYEEKEKTSQKYLYIENKELEEIALRDNQAEEKEILFGSMDEVMKKINQATHFAVAIYTKNAENAYHFINLANSQNVLVNTSLANAKSTQNSPYELYQYKNIILPIPKEAKKDTVEQEKLEKEEQTSLQIVNKTILGRIKEFLKRIFHS